MSRRRVVVTGLGIVSPVGNAVPEAWENALAGKSGITRVTRFDPSRLSSQIAGEVKGFDIAQYLSLKEARRMDTFIHYGMAAGLQAWRDAGVTLSGEAAERAGINFGSGIGGLPLIEQTHDELLKSGPRRISPFFIPGTIINMIAGNLSIMLGLKGPNLAMVTACPTLSGLSCVVIVTSEGSPCVEKIPKYTLTIEFKCENIQLFHEAVHVHGLLEATE